MKENLKSTEDILPFIERLTQTYNDARVWLLIGELGAGKTTLSKDLVKALGGKGTVTSPTYTIINEHDKDDGGIVYHIDAYRLGENDPVIESLIEESLENPKNHLVIEWPDKVSLSFLPKHIEIRLEIMKDGSRMVEVVEVD